MTKGSKMISYKTPHDVKSNKMYNYTEIIYPEINRR